MGIQSILLSNNLSTFLQKSLSERLETASLNTLLGLIIVFSVLILIILIISMFRIIPYLMEKRSNKVEHTESSNSAVDNVINQIIKNEETEVITEDYELIAVITAAICASMGDTVPADGLIVRSIRKVNKRR